VKKRSGIEMPWRTPLAVDGADPAQRPLVAERAAPGRSLVADLVVGSTGGGGCRGGLVVLQDGACIGELPPARGREEAVVADLGEAPREDVLQEAGDEGRRFEIAAADLAGPRVGVSEDHTVVLGACDAILGDCDPVDVASEVGGDSEAIAGPLDVDDPRAGPGLGRRLVGEPGEGAPDAGTKESGQGEARHEEARVGGAPPGVAVDTAGGHHLWCFGALWCQALAPYPRDCPQGGDKLVAVMRGERQQVRG
jgi:hypothetical protein